MGKTRVEQVILTHSHYDHASLLPKIVELFNPKVYAYSEAQANVTHRLKRREVLKVGDRVFDVIYTPGHSNDSICLYCGEGWVLFAGDTGAVITSIDGAYEHGFVAGLEILCKKISRQSILDTVRLCMGDVINCCVRHWIMSERAGLSEMHRVQIIVICYPGN